MPLLAGKPRAGKQLGELPAAEGDRGALAVKPFDAGVGKIQVVLGAAREILQPELVLDREDQHSALGQPRARPPQAFQHGICGVDEAAGILQHPDQRHHVESFPVWKLASCR